MSKVFAWVLFISSVVCFALAFRTQQLAVAAERYQDVLSQPPDRELFLRASTAGEEAPLEATGEMPDDAQADIEPTVHE